MSYYLKTLEGVPRFLGEVPQERRDMVRRAFDVYWQMTTDVKDLTERFYKVFNYLTRVYTDEEIYTLVDRPDVHPSAAEAWMLFSINQGRKASAARAAQSASEAEAARIAALQQQHAQEEAEAERDALDARKRADKARREAEAAQAEAEAEADAAAAQVAAEATQIINQGGTMNDQNIEIGTQVISSGHEYTVIDETPTTIVYEDETGKMYVEEKPKSNGIFLLLAAAAAFFILG